ncbi:hypothetical protein FOZ61_006961 [Perkinsus olseni]|uniref:Inner centromere protein ARK-binding domain-containing protein n=2 Tax=Perkinsus olseni TaxID=32597 RepID=A0A7J6LAZ6_PEROL|nr:hypothetical protein FOZ61_006961 [Perkinsus olseni]
MASKHLSEILEAAGEWFELQVLAAETEFSILTKASVDFRAAVSKLNTFEEQALQLVAGTPLPTIPELNEDAVMRQVKRMEKAVDALERTEAPKIPKTAPNLQGTVHLHTAAKTPARFVPPPQPQAEVTTKHAKAVPENKAAVVPIDVADEEAEDSLKDGDPRVDISEAVVDITAREENTPPQPSGAGGIVNQLKNRFMLNKKQPAAPKTPSAEDLRQIPSQASNPFKAGDKGRVTPGFRTPRFVPPPPMREEDVVACEPGEAAMQIDEAEDADDESEESEHERSIMKTCYESNAFDSLPGYPTEKGRHEDDVKFVDALESVGSMKKNAPPTPVKACTLTLNTTPVVIGRRSCAPQRQELKPLPTLDANDQYDVSEKDTDNSDQEKGGKPKIKKRIPEWSRQWKRLVRDQASVDPESVFGCAVPATDLDQIFNDGNYRHMRMDRPRRKRGSSACWYFDALTQKEIDEYRLNCGQTEKVEDIFVGGRRP